MFDNGGIPHIHEHVLDFGELNLDLFIKVSLISIRVIEESHG